MFRMLTVLLLVLLSVSNTNAMGKAQPEAATTSDWQLVAAGINVPWGMAQLPNGDILVTEKSGKLHLIRDGQLLEKTIGGVPEVAEIGQGGLLDVAIHPEFSENGFIYLSYASAEGDGDGANTAILRARLQDMQLQQQQVLYKAQPNTGKSQHFGSRIVLTADGYLFFSIGDRGQRDVNPQDLSRDGGKIYRLHDDGRVPADNPFVDNDKALPAIYSYGHRNPQGMALHPQSGQLWSHEHGPKGGDEVNLVKPGVNYGWPVISYGINYWGTKFTDLTEKEGMAQPAWYWDPSIAPSGLIYVDSDRYPQWQGKWLVGSLKFNYLVLLSEDDGEIRAQEIVLQDIGRVRSLLQGNDGYIYVGLDGQGVVRLTPQRN